MSDENQIKCVCGTVLKNKQGLQQHLRRTCKGPKENNKPLQCADCDKVYMKLQSLNQHRRHAHPDEYNQEMKKEAVVKKKPWTDAEVQYMAELEANHEGSDSVNTFLAMKLERSLESVKCRRKYLSYKTLVDDLKKNSTEINQPSPNKSEQRNSILEETEAKSPQLTYISNPLWKFINNLCENVDLTSYGNDIRNLPAGAHPQTLINNLLSDIESTSQLKYFSGKSKSISLNYIKEEPEDITVKTFCKSMSLDYIKEEPEDEQTEINKPILVSEIHQAFDCWKSNAAVIDETAVEFLKNKKIGQLLLLFNTILLTAYVPDSFKWSRTNNYNYQPVKNIFYIILAKRLSNVSKFNAQETFWNVDKLFIQSIIKEHRSKAVPYNTVSLEINKSFDYILPSIINRALTWMEIHEEIKKLIREIYNISYVKTESYDQDDNDDDDDDNVDPLSAIIFKFLMYELLNEIDQKNGLKVGNNKLAAVLLENNLFVMGSDQFATQISINFIVEFLNKINLSVNTAKCSAVATYRVPAKKKLFCSIEPIFFINGEPILPAEQ